MATQFNTLNNLLAALQDIATRHKQINTFGVGDDWEVGASQANIHPVLWVNPVSASMDKGENGYTSYDVDFNVKVFDLVNKDESNENEVLSDCFEILKDVVTEFNTHPYYIESAFSIIGSLSFQKFTKKFDDEVSGWEVVMKLEAPNKRSFCGIPVEPITNYGSYTGGCSTVVIDTSSTDVHITGFTYDSANSFIISDNTGGTFTAVIEIMTGLTVNGSITASTYYGDGSNLSGITSLWTDGGASPSLFPTGFGTTTSTGFGTITAAYNSSSTGIYGSIWGGLRNTNIGYYAAIVGGLDNSISSTASSNYGFIGGGRVNVISGTARHGVILGGELNQLTAGNHSAIVGGVSSVISNQGSFIGGGSNHTIFWNYSGLIGGRYNTINALYSFQGGSYSSDITGWYAGIVGGIDNNVTGYYSGIFGGRNNTVTHTNSIALGGSGLTSTADNTVYVPYLNIGSINTTTTATTYNNLVIDSGGNIMKNNQFYIGVNFTVTGVTWDYVALETFSIYSIDNPSSIGYDLIHNGTAYTLSNVINVYDDLQITGVTSTGVLKLNCNEQ